jgi:DNA-binding NtrC family response regulator
MPRCLVLLEDTPGRVRVVDAWADGRDDLELVHYARAPELIAWLEEHLSEAVLISLDYHLGGAGPGAGSGFDVALWLARREPTCPVIVHTSDSTAATYVCDALVTGGWDAVVAPFSSETWPTTAESQLA